MATFGGTDSGPTHPACKRPADWRSCWPPACVGQLPKAGRPASGASRPSCQAGLSAQTGAGCRSNWSASCLWRRGGGEASRILIECPFSSVRTRVVTRPAESAGQLDWWPASGCSMHSGTSIESLLLPKITGCCWLGALPSGFERRDGRGREGVSQVRRSRFGQADRSRARLLSAGAAQGASELRPSSVGLPLTVILEAGEQVEPPALASTLIPLQLEQAALATPANLQLQHHARPPALGCLFLTNRTSR